jgi:hypothetical protein
MLQSDLEYVSHCAAVPRYYSFCRAVIFLSRSDGMFWLVPDKSRYRTNAIAGVGPTIGVIATAFLA